MDISVLRKRRRLYANQDEIDKRKPGQVKKVAPAPQGSAKYEVEYNDAEPLSVVVDKWRWDRAQPCKRAGFCKGGRRTLQLCLGSLECANKSLQTKSTLIDLNIVCTVTVKPLRNIARPKNILKTTGVTKMTVIYLQKRDCSPKQERDKPSKEELENILIL